jgi:hypothetical protein
MTLSRRIRQVFFGLLAVTAVAAGSVAAVGVTASSPAFAAEGSCADGSVVVVDSSDLGGTLEVRCAVGSQESGRAALLAAGFTVTDSQPGFLCAINAMPDPCPETFDGSFWAYWHATPDGEWMSYQVGADSSSPMPGEIEGWRYNKGTVPPGITPSEAAATATPAPTPDATETPSAALPGSGDQVDNPRGSPADERASQNLILLTASVGFLALVAAVIIMFVVRQRRHRGEPPPPAARD